jgi:transposase
LPISKDKLDVHRLPDGERRQFKNDATGQKALIAFIGKADVARVVLEPTRPYHRAFEAALAKAGLPLVKVNPRQARRFAEAIGKLAKTDRIDAANLARMGALLALEVRHPQPEILNELKELYVALEALVKDRTAAKNRQKQLTLALLKRENTQRLTQIERQIQALEAEIEVKLAADPTLARKLEILTSIPSVSTITAFAFIVEMPELGTLDGKQASSLAGLAPVARQSGRWNGRASVAGGRANVRQALYMPALVAVRFNKDLKAKYDWLIKSGKPAKVAITAIMRKLVVLANALLRENRRWVEKAA